MEASTTSTICSGQRTRENVQRNSHPFPLKRMIQAIDPLHPQRSTMKIQTTTGPRRVHLQATIQIPIPRPPTQTPTTIQIPDSPRPQRSTGEPAQSAIPIYRFRSATLRARTTRLTNESTKSAQPRHSPPRRYDTPLASDARNGRKHTYNLRHRQTKSNTG